MDYESMHNLEEYISNQDGQGCKVSDWIKYRDTYAIDDNKTIPEGIWRSYSYSYDIHHVFKILFVSILLVWQASKDMVPYWNIVTVPIYAIVLIIFSFILGLMISLLVITPNWNRKRKYKKVLKKIHKEYDKQKHKLKEI